jgi:ankyrin repeat protein
MKRIVLAVLTVSVPLAAQTQSPPPAQAKVDYEKDVRPLLSQHCYGCHGDTVQQSGLRLDLRQNALRGGDYGPVIIPGKSGESKLIRRVVDGDGGVQMPPTGPLSQEEIDVLRAWIDQGAEFRTEIAEQAPPKPIDPRVADAIAAVRSQPRARIEALLARDPDLIDATDVSGSTLLHHAAGFGALETMALLLERGADPNAKNRRKSTPLHWAIHDEAKVRALLARGAAVNGKQVEGRTPLYLAASLGDGANIVRVLLEHGADPSLAAANGQTPLMAAAVRGHMEVLRLLLDAKADVNAKNGAGETALMLAASSGSPRAVGLLLDRGADARVRTKRNETALGNAATAGVEETVRLLLDAGAEVNVRNIRGYSPLMLAAGSDAAPAGIIRSLLARGADTSYTADYAENARDLAMKRGDTQASRLLGAEWSSSPAALASHPSRSRTEQSIATSVEKALALLEKQSYNFIRISGCNSCHSQDLPSAAAAFARGRGLRAPGEIPQLPESLMPPPARLMDFGIVALAGPLWELFDAGMNGVAPNEYTDAAVRLIRSAQTADGNWSANESRRPPMASGDLQAAALAIYALKHYGRAVDKDVDDRAVTKAVAWLARANPETTQDRAFHLLALVWAGGNADIVRNAARALAAMQQRDGGWSQFPTLASDAYATGQVLFALNTAGAMPVSDPVYRKGVEYLLQTQADDGSWHVKSRSIWLQPYFESGFPYGQDQFISAAGTAWASMALTAAVEPPTSARR